MVGVEVNNRRLTAGKEKQMTVDYAGIVTEITAQLTPALTAALGVAGIILGVKYGYRFFKSFSRG